MKVEPSAADLIEIARAAIVADLVPALPDERRYAALMAANALAIAARDLAAPADDGGETASIAVLLGAEPAGSREGNARLAARIREGAFDEGEPRAKLLAYLRAATAARLAVSNPRALKR